jgi:hypothetical protein
VFDLMIHCYKTFWSYIKKNSVGVMDDNELLLVERLTLEPKV